MKVPAGAKTKKNDVSFPVFLDEAKSVYITEDPSASTSYHYPPFAEEWPPYSCIRMGHQLVE